jgi:2-iminoacetate synthase
MLPPTFQELLDAIDLHRWRERSVATTRAEVARALSSPLPVLDRMAALVSPVAQEEFLEELAERSHRLTVQRFGRVLQMYAPLYVSNECVDTCTYCGFSRGNPMPRITLDRDEVEREADVLLEEGFRHVLLVSGEHPKIVSTGYLTAMVRRLRPKFASISIEVAPQDEEGYRELVAAGVDSLALYQETYDRDVYAAVHVAGRKKNYDWRLAAPERAARAGMKRIGIGALLGLGDWRHDALAVALHADWLQRRCWRSVITVSVPRLRAAIGAIEAPSPVDDRSLAQYVCALRLCLPDAGIVLSTRELAPLRDGLVRIGVTQLSAGSRTEPGGYQNPDPDAEQFEIADTRSTQAVAARLTELGYEVVWKDWEATLHGRA